ncbi:MAG: energy-coupling factor ABC transporter ATP-binding protein [Candidatus Desulfofervidaceae bacterium]|nr:energy-coupling factor ABC transporter ATP-binding protein [Candidatus Desulfofervidaceae bacterium]
MEVIKLEDISFAYPGGKIVLHGLNFSLKKGERVGIMGPNGTGKTTFLQIIVGLLKPQAGRVVIMGKERQAETDFYEVRSKIGLMFQDPDDQLFCPTVAEEIAFGPLNLGIPRQEVAKIVSRTLGLVGLAGFEDRVTYKLSGGEKRLVALASLLAMQPEVLLLDEPTGDLDPQNIKRFVSILSRLSLSYLIVSHDKQFLQQVTQKQFWFEDGRFLPLDTFHP